MGRKRVAIERLEEANQWVARFNHPILKRSIRFVLAPLSDLKTADTNLERLNNIFLHKSNWYTRPPETPDAVWNIWANYQRPLGLPDHETQPPLEIEDLAVQQLGHELYTALREALRDKFQIPLLGTIETLRTDLATAQKELEHHRGRKFKAGPSLLLGATAEQWLTAYKGRDAGHYATVAGDIRRFAKALKPNTRLEDITERAVDTWLQGMTVTKAKSPNYGKPIGAARRRNARTYVLKFLRDSGANLDVAAVPQVTNAQLRAGRGAIRWLERAQAERIAKKLPAYWRALFKVQIGLGLRPDELLTLHRDNFTPARDRVTLSPRGHFTLKTGPRTVQVPEKVQTIIKARLKLGPVVFPKPDGAEWVSVTWFNKRYHKALVAAATAAKVTTTMDCRIGRRTCASLLLRSGMSYADVAAILGDRPETIRQHYAAILPHEVNPTAAAL